MKSTITYLGILGGLIFVLGNAWQYFQVDLPETITIMGIIIGVIIIVGSIYHDRFNVLKRDVEAVENWISDRNSEKRE